MNRNNRSDDDMYNVSTYTDTELYDVLDLSNPTDRELEAKIIFLYRKYKNMQNSSGEQLARFFNDIYNRFFENEDDPETEIVQEGMTSLTDIKKMEDIEKPKLDISVDSRTFNIDEQSTTDTKQTINFVKQLDYTGDTINPLLQQTTTRVISIDSQYRADKNALSTEFTFDLSDPLKDVVSLSLYSVQIPYTWYTIAKSYGSNFFYVKGNSPGINNGNHDIKIEISPGNYSPSELSTTIDASIKNMYSVYSDISFGNTNISYNQNTSLSTIKVGIIKQYSENSYDLSLSNWTTPNLYDSSGNIDDFARSQGPYASIASFLGLNKKTYHLNTINSGLFTPIDVLSNDNISYKIDPLSVTFNIIKYTSKINDIRQSQPYNETTSYVDQIIPIKLSLLTNGTKYSRNDIVSDISNQLFNNIYLSNESYIKLIEVTDASDVRYGYSYYQVRIKPNRYTTNNITNSKIFIQFPIETNISEGNTSIWTGNTSCFRFLDLSNELQLIKSETPIVKQTNVYTIVQGPYVKLRCVNPNFISIANDISFQLKINQDNNTNIYTVTQLVNSINAGIIAQTIKTPFLNGLPSLSYIYDPGSNKPPSYTMAFIDTNYKFSLGLDIEKYFVNRNYKVNFVDTSFNTLFKLGNTLTGAISDSPLTDVTSITSTFDKRTIYNGSVLFRIDPIQDMCGNELDNIGPIIYNSDENNAFYDYGILSNTLTSYLINYTYKGERIFTNQTSFSIIQTTPSSIQVTLNLYISRMISSKDYTVQFIDDISANRTNIATPTIFWKDPLNLGSDIRPPEPTPLVDNSYNLSTANSPYLTLYTGSTTIVVKGSTPIKTVTINFGKIDNTFTFNGYEDGVYSKSNTNNIKITIPIYDSNQNLINYTRDALIVTINNLLSNDVRSFGSHLSLSTPDAYDNYYLQIFSNINKIYNAVDYKLVFYDALSYVKCFVGAKGIQNTTWDSTLGWILGFRNSTYYNLNNPDSTYIFPADSNNIVTIISDTAVSTNLFNYFLICLDDYNLNHLNDGLVTITGQDTSVPLPSYADRSNFQCDPTTGQLSYNANTASVNDPNSQLTQNQLYALTQKANAKNSTSSNISGGETSSSYGRGPFSQDVFAVIPMKLSGLANGAYFVEYGGTLQNNNRYYFGPVNIHRMSVKLISDKGNTVDLNGANWSFSFLCQQLYKKREKPKK
jgi:hypothetical protein